MAKPKIGKAKYGGQKKKYWKLKDGESVFRVLPPLGELADDGKWSMYYRVHYGYRNAEGKSRPFQSSLVIDRETKQVECADAALDRIETLKERLEAAKAKKDKASVEALLKLVGGAKSQYNLDNNHYLNVIDEQGNIGVLKLRHKAKLALDMTIRELRDKGIDPLSVDNGRFFVFSRSGNALETTFKVTVKKQQIEVAGIGTVEKDLVHVLTDDIIDRLSDEAAQLNKLFRAPTSEQVEQIVKESDLKTGNSPNIDAILGIKTKDGAPAEAQDDADIYEDDDSEVVESKPEVKAETKVEAKKEAPVEKVEVKAEPKAEPKAEVKPAATDKVSQMSNEEFLASLGLN